jgi:hypothetical protein
LALGTTQILIEWVLGVLSMGVKQYEVDQLLPPSAKVRMTAAMSLPLYIFMAKAWATLLLLIFHLVICVK